jgi:hypothetical protein
MSHRLPAYRERVPVISYPCRKLDDEASGPFRFTGKVVDGVLSGPGKLFLTGNGLATSNEVCLHVGRVLVRAMDYLLPRLYISLYFCSP